MNQISMNNHLYEVNNRSLEKYFIVDCDRLVTLAIELHVTIGIFSVIYSKTCPTEPVSEPEGTDLQCTKVMSPAK